MYLAKNQDKYSFNLSSNDFMLWSGLGYKAYTTAFDELITEGYMVLEDGKKSTYVFYDKSRKPPKEEDITVDIPEEKVKEIREAAAAAMQ